MGIFQKKSLKNLEKSIWMYRKVIIITQGLSPIVKPIRENYSVVGIIESAPRRYLKYSNKKSIFINCWDL